LSLRSYSDIDTNLVERADRAVQASSRPSVMTGEEALAALRHCQHKQAIREGDPRAVRVAMTSVGLPVVEDIYSIGDRQFIVKGGKPTWYAVQTAPGMELRAKRDLSKLGHECRVPMREFMRKTNRSDKHGKRILVRAETPLCTGYAFLSIATVRPDWRIIRSREGVTDVVGVGGAPQPIRDMDLLEAIFDADAAGAFKIREPKVWALEPDMQVRIAEGPFAGFIAKIVAAKGDAVKLIINGLFGGAKVDVKKDQLEPA
jgi:transcription antitermination factor NusG